MINTFIGIVYYSGISFLVIFVSKFIYELIKRNKPAYLSSLRLLLNFAAILIFCWLAFMSLAILVKPSSEIAESREKSLENLSQWIVNQEIKIGLAAIFIIGILGIANYLYQQKIEKINSRISTLRLTIINFVIVTISLILIYHHTYEGLAPEVEYYFKG